MNKRDLLIPEEVIKSAGFESNNLVAVVENGLIRIVEEDEEYCYGFFVVEVDKTENKSQSQNHSEKQQYKEKQLLSRKGTVYIPVKMRDLVEFEIGSILELSIVPDGILLKKVKM